MGVVDTHGPAQDDDAAIVGEVGYRVTREGTHDLILDFFCMERIEESAGPYRLVVVNDEKRLGHFALSWARARSFLRITLFDAVRGSSSTKATCSILNSGLR